MKNVMICLVASLVLYGCKNKDNKTVNNDLPDCLNRKIESIKSGEEKFPPILIAEYEYKGRKVFLIGADCCDQFDIVVDEQCKTVCAPSGGIDGGGDGKCTDFMETAKRVKIVWEKENRQQ